MAKRKSASVPKSAAERTTALVFINGDQDLAADSDPIVMNAVPAAQFEEIPEDTKFPFKLLYQLQDFLNDHVTLVKGVQILVCLYITQIFYLYLSRNQLDDAMYSTCFNILGGVLAMYLSHRSQLQKHETLPDVYKYPSLPEFNTIYSIFVPTLLVLLMSNFKDSYFQANLALSNFAIKSLHPVAKVVSAFVFYYMYNDEETIELFQFMKVIWIYYSVEFALSTWNESHKTNEEGETIVSTSLSSTEIHFVAMACVNLLTHLELLPVTPNTIPLYILRILVLSLIIACALAFPLYELCKYLGTGLAKEGVSLIVIAVFCGSFYYATNYQFDLFVAKKEVLQWLYEYVTQSLARTKLLSTWLMLLLGAIPVMFLLSTSNILSLNMRRKVWHFMLLATLTYPLVQDPQFTSLAILGSSIVFVVFEFLRCTQITFVGRWLHTQLRLFQDDKDLAGPLNLSYIFLLVGTGIPIAYGLAVEDPVSIRSYLGLATLGLGDSVASIVGKNFGKIKWRGGVKTFEGTLAYIVATFAYFVFVDFYVLPEASRVNNWENMVIVAMVGGVIEGTSTLNDNVLVPAMSLISFEVLNRVFPGQ